MTVDLCAESALFYDIESFKRRIMNKSSWRKESFGDGEIEIGAELGQFGATSWHIKVSDSKDCIILKPTPDGAIKSLASKIRGVEDYWNSIHAKNKGLDIPNKNKISKLWIDIVKSAFSNDISIRSDVALISSSPIEVKGLKVIPKEWGNPLQDEIIVSFCNFWVSSYDNSDYPHKSIFRLSSYNAKNYGVTSAKSSTEYIDLHPFKDEETIEKILDKAVAIYMPDVTTIGNLRTVI